MKSDQYTVNKSKRLHSAYSAVKVRSIKSGAKKPSNRFGDVTSFMSDANVTALRKNVNRGASDLQLAQLVDADASNDQSFPAFLAL